MEAAAAPSVAGYESLDSETESSHSSPPRPNEFGGPESSWRALTQQDRVIFESLVRLRNQDLSIHLYNAHAMKSRQHDVKAYSKLDPWASKDRWRVAGNQEINQDLSRFVPPKTWTAWPLDPTSVPRPGDRVGEGDGNDAYTFKRRTVEGPSEELIELMIAATLKIAKEKFESREWDDSTYEDRDQLGKEKMEGTAIQQDLALSEYHKPQDMQNKPDYGSLEESHTSQAAELIVPVADSAADSSETKSSSKSKGEPKMLKSPSELLRNKENAFHRPVISADDERSRVLLEPSIRHNISQLDKLLRALHHARKTCLHNKSDGSSSAAKSVEKSGAESEDAKSTASAAGSEKSSAKRPVGRPRKTIDFSKIQTQSSSQLESNSDTQLAKSKPGRKRKIHQPLEGESHEEMLVRIARKQKKPLPFTSKSPPRKKLGTSKDNSSTDDQRSRVSESRQRMGLGIRDWSEILGTAALVGFPPDVLHRAAQRCSTLFGEGITLRSLVENPIPGKDEDEVMHYEPEEIPYLDEGESSVGSPTKEGIFTARSPGQGLYFCPLRDCVRSQNGFKRRSNLRRHLTLTHKLNREELNDAMEDSENEMDGAVHVDGFMKPVKRRQWREGDKLVRKQRGRNRGRIQQRSEPDGQDSDGSSSVGSSEEISTVFKDGMKTTANEEKATGKQLEDVSGDEDD